MKQEIYFSKTSKSAGLADFGQIKKAGHSNVTGSPKCQAAIKKIFWRFRMEDLNPCSENHDYFLLACFIKDNTSQKHSSIE